MSWHSVHVHRHDGEVTDLVLDAVRPLFHQLGDSVSGAHHLRHWRRGPHLRLNIRTDEDTFRTSVRPAVEEIVGGYLLAHPSTAQVDPAALLDEHRRLARLEAERGPLLPWEPDNSICYEPYDERVDVLGGRQAAELLADMHTATTDLAFAMTERQRSGGQRTAMAFDLLVATAHSLSGLPLTEGYVSFRSHAEGFLSSFPEGPQLRPRWEAHYAHHAEQLRARVRHVVDRLETGADCFAGEWVRLLAPIRRRAGQLIEQGGLVLDTPWLRDNYDPGVRLDPAQSPFHAELAAQGRGGNTSSRADWFQQYRAMLNYLYLFLTRLGVRPGERYLLCHLTADAVEDTYDVSAMDVIRRPGFAEGPAR